MSQDILILGASIRAAAQSASQAGYTPYGSDLFCDVDTQRCATVSRVGSYPNGLLDVAAELQPMPWIYTGAIENHPRLIDAISAKHILWGNNAAKVRRVRDVKQLQAILADNGMPFPETCTTPEGLSREGAWLRKAICSAGGMHVDVWDEHSSPGVTTHKYVWQRRIAGRSVSAVFVSDGNRSRLLGATAQRLFDTSRGDFRYAGSSTVLPELDVITDQLDRAGAVIASEFQLVGLFGIDAMVDGRTVWPVEVNPRYTASVEILERAGGGNAIELHVATCCGIQIDDVAIQSLDCHAAKRVVYADRDQEINEPFAEWARSLNANEPWPVVADVPVVGSTVSANQPIATLLVSGESSTDIDRRESSLLNEMWQRLGE